MEESKRWGRYTFLGFDPVLELTCRDGLLKITSGTTIGQQVEHPGEAIRKILAENKSPKLPGMPTFTGGLVGYFAYDYIKYAEPKLKLEKGDADSFQDVDLMLFDKVIAFDNFRQKILLIVNMKTGALEQEYYKAQLELEKLVNLIRNGKPAPEQPLKLKTDFKPAFSKEAYCEMVEKGKRYIREGDIFQVVLSNQLEAEMEGSRRAIYGGAIGYLDFSGNLDVCIAIRIAYAKKGKVYARSGAGIVADSVPESEYQECLNKARAVVLAVKKAEEGMEA